MSNEHGQGSARGRARKIKNGIERTDGTLVGNKSLETDGEIAQAAGNVRKDIVEARDLARESVNDRKT